MHSAEQYNLTIPSIQPYSNQLKEDLLNIGFSFSVAPFLSHYEDRYPDIFKLFERIGIDPRSNQPKLINPFNNQPDQESYSNIGEHIIAAAVIMDGLLESLLRFNLVTMDVAEQARRYIMIHDLNKVFEIQERKAFAEQKIERAHSKLYQILEDEGLSFEQIAEVKKISSMTTFDGLAMFLRPDVDRGIKFNPVNIAGSLTRLADDMTCSRRGRHYIFPPLQRFIASDFFTETTKHAIFWGIARISSSGELTIDISKEEISANPSTSPFILGQVAALHMASADLTIENLLSSPNCPAELKSRLQQEGAQTLIYNLAKENIKARLQAL